MSLLPKPVPEDIRSVIEALQALRGVAQMTAATIVCELGSLSRFQSPRQLRGYSGLVSREHSSGNRIPRGAITKTGNAHLRRVLVEAAWAYQHRPNVTGFLLRRQKILALSDESNRWPGKHSIGFTNVTRPGRRPRQEQESIVTALGRELLGFIWAIAVHTEAQKTRKGCLQTGDVFLDSNADDSAGPMKRRTSSVLCATVSGPNPRPQSEAAPNGSCPCGSDPRISE